MPNTKHYVITAITLALIGAGSAAIIGGTNLLTNSKIKENEKKKIQQGIAEIFGQNSSVLNDEGEAIDKEKYKEENIEYTNTMYLVKQEGLEENQYAFRVDGSNMYGKISLLVGFNHLHQFLGLSIITNEQTYAATLNENYFEPLKEADNKDEALEDVSCGATYGAKLVRNMVNDAKKVVNKMN